MHDIVDLKENLAKKFAMKDLDKSKIIIRMKITRDKQNHMLKLIQEDYIENALKGFNIKDAQIITTPLKKYFKLIKDLCPKIKEEKSLLLRLSILQYLGV